MQALLMLPPQLARRESGFGEKLSTGDACGTLLAALGAGQNAQLPDESGSNVFAGGNRQTNYRWLPNSVRQTNGKELCNKCGSWLQFKLDPSETKENAKCTQVRPMSTQLPSSGPKCSTCTRVAPVSTRAACMPWSQVGGPHKKKSQSAKCGLSTPSTRALGSARPVASV